MTYGARPLARQRFALDRSLRSVDSDGHLVVEMSRISKACVNGYRGNEVPRWEELGLDPDRIYQLYRDPQELAKAASSFSGKPLLMRHVPVTAELPNQSLWVGTVGKVTFESPYLIARPLTVIDGEAQALVESEQQRELSAGYRYVADMTPGTTPEGERYQGVMRSIAGNHVAIVSAGRAGADVHVADELPAELRSMRRTRPTPADKRLARQHLALGHFERAYALDASLRPRRRSEAELDAIVEAVLERGREERAHAADKRSTSSRTKSMRRQSPRGLPARLYNSIFQRQIGDRDYREPLSRAHALDEADPSEAAPHVEASLNHVIAAASGGVELDLPRLQRHLESALEALGGGEAEDDEEGRTEEEDMTAAERHLRQSGEPSVGDIGETPARAVVTTASVRRVSDHRDDFRSGADASHGYDGGTFDADTLFQKR